MIRSCPLGHEYDPDIHDAIANLRILEGSLPEHARHGSAFNCFAPKREMKYWVRESTPAFGFFYYTLDMVICPYLVSSFGGINTWHPYTETEGNELLATRVDV